MLLAAYDEGMFDNGEFAFITIDTAANEDALVSMAPMCSPADTSMSSGYVGNVLGDMNAFLASKLFSSFLPLLGLMPPIFSFSLEPFWQRVIVLFPVYLPSLYWSS